MKKDNFYPAISNIDKYSNATDDYGNSCSNTIRTEAGCNEYFKSRAFDREIDYYLGLIDGLENDIVGIESTLDSKLKAYQDNHDKWTAELEALWNLDNPTKANQIRAMYIDEKQLDDNIKRMDYDNWYYGVKIKEKEDAIDVYNKKIVEIEGYIKDIIDRRPWIGRKRTRQDNRAERKANRVQRREIRKAKRDAKAKLKQELRDKYGKGKDYRTAKREGIKVIKEVKKTALEDAGGSFWYRLKKVNPISATVRNAFLLLIKINAFNIATRMSNLKTKNLDAYNNLLDMFYKWGGKKENFVKEIDRGKDKKAIMSFKGNNAVELIKENNNATGGGFWNLAGEEVVALVVACAPLLTEVVSALGKEDGGAKTLPDGEVDTNSTKPTDEELKKALSEAGFDGGEKDPLIPLWAWIVGGVILVGGTVAIVMVSKSK